MTGEQRLWQSVIERALIDAHWTGRERNKNGTRNPMVYERAQADSWLRNGGANFREVCDLAGIDADFLRAAYVGGRINMNAYKAAETAQSLEAAE